MAFRRSDLQEAFFVPGTHAFRVWGYATTDPLEEVLARNYFELGRALLRPGELIYVSTAPRRAQAGGPERGERRLALVMVRGDARGPERADGSVRLVQDFGRSDDPPGSADATLLPVPADATPAAPAKRGRGRPPGSR
jgi:hypothetical protein